MQFDLYTITNLSLMDIAEYLTMRPNLFAVTKQNLGDLEEVVTEFSSKSLHLTSQSTFELLPEVPSISRKEVTLAYDATFDVTVRNNHLF